MDHYQSCINIISYIMIYQEISVSTLYSSSYRISYHQFISQ